MGDDLCCDGQSMGMLKELDVSTLCHKFAYIFQTVVKDRDILTYTCHCAVFHLMWNVIKNSIQSWELFFPSLLST